MRDLSFAVLFPGIRIKIKLYNFLNNLEKLNRLTGVILAIGGNLAEKV